MVAGDITHFPHLIPSEQVVIPGLEPLAERFPAARSVKTSSDAWYQRTSG